VSAAPAGNVDRNRQLVADAVRDLDAYAPDWRSRVDVDRLNMDDARLCVLGQVFGSWITGLIALYDLEFVETADAFDWNFPVELWRDELTRPAGAAV
jgi:hypothetical protein